jgi:hypothetical protein
MVKFLATVILSLVLLLTIVLPVQAATCRNFNNHTICILEIKRSAKNYWEYRAAISIDGAKRSTEVYNCRTRTRFLKNGIAIPFEADGVSELICKSFRG